MFGFDELVNLAATQVSHEQDQNRAHSDMVEQNQFTLDRTNAAQDFQQFMRSTAYQATVDDLKKAGLNPMLALAHGPTNAPSVPTPTSSPNTVYGGGPGSAPTSAAYLAKAEVKKLEASAERDKAEADRTRQTLQPDIDLTKQKTEESRAAAAALIQQARTGTASAANLEQQTRNLQAQMPIFEETVKNLRALTTLHGEQANLAYKQAGYTQTQQQQMETYLREDFPKLEAAFLRLKTQHSQLGLQSSKAEAAAYTTRGGQPDALLAFLRALPVPFANTMPTRNY